MVKKIMNEPQNIVDEMLEGFVFAHEEIEWFPNYRVVALKEKKKGKVGIMSVGGSGHEPAHAGYVGKGMLDAAVAGNLFASPSPDQMLKAMEEINTGAGVLVVLKNYSGDLMNYSVAKELAQMKGIEVECVVVKDDVAVPDSTYSTGRRGIAGTIFVHKIAGAKANEGASLQEVKEAAEIANANIRSIGMSMTACTLPGLDKPGFTVADDEIEIGMEPEELIVGNRTKGVRYGVVFPESGISWVDREFETIPTRPQDKFNVRPEDIETFRKVIVPYWKGKSLEDVIKNRFGNEISAISKVVKVNQTDHAQGHICPNVKEWLELGPQGYILSLIHI